MHFTFQHHIKGNQVESKGEELHKYKGFVWIQKVALIS